MMDGRVHMSAAAADELGGAALRAEMRSKRMPPDVAAVLRLRRAAVAMVRKNRRREPRNGN